MLQFYITKYGLTILVSSEPNLIEKFDNTDHQILTKSKIPDEVFFRFDQIVIAHDFVLQSCRPKFRTVIFTLQLSVIELVQCSGHYMNPALLLQMYVSGYRRSAMRNQRKAQKISHEIVTDT